MSQHAFALLESRIETLLDDPAASSADLHAALDELYGRYRTQQDMLDRLSHNSNKSLDELYERNRAQQQMLDRLVRISDKYQWAQRQHGQSHAEQLERKVRQVEKIVRISDGYQSMLQDLHARLTAISNHDDLTGLANRRYMQDRLKQAIAQSGRTSDVFSVAMV
ncbi:MAG: diguanylate cyclase domain-containing protein, partial [Rhodoferax sp.]